MLSTGAWRFESFHPDYRVTLEVTLLSPIQSEWITQPLYIRKTKIIELKINFLPTKEGFSKLINIEQKVEQRFLCKL